MVLRSTDSKNGDQVNRYINIYYKPIMERKSCKTTRKTGVPTEKSGKSIIINV